MPQKRPPKTIPLVPTIFLIVMVGAAMLGLSQFMTLFHTHISGSDAVVASTSVGSDHSWALLPAAALAAGLGLAVLLSRSRPALLGVGLLGILAAVIALGHDLSNARAHGVRPSGTNYAAAANTVAGGLYVELGAALLLLVAAVGGFLLWVPPAPTLQGVGSGRGADAAPTGGGHTASR